MLFDVMHKDYDSKLCESGVGSYGHRTRPSFWLSFFSPRQALRCSTGIKTGPIRDASYAMSVTCPVFIARLVLLVRILSSPNRIGIPITRPKN